MRTLLLATLLLLLASSWFAVPTDDEPEIDFSHDLAMPVGETFYVGTASKGLRKRAARLVGEGSSFLDDVHFFRGTARARGATEDVECIFAYFPFTGTLDGARMIMAIQADGTIVTAGLWGVPEFDEEPYGRWGPFVGGLIALSTSGGIDEAQTLEEAERSLSKLGNDDEQRIRAHIDLRRIMYGYQSLAGFAHRLRQTQKPIPEGFVTPLIEETKRLEELTPILAPFLTESERATFVERVRGMGTELEEFERLAKEGDEAETQAFLEAHVGARLCSACHRAPLESGGSVRNTVRLAIMREEAPRGLLELGFDLSPALGDHDGWSERMAKAFRATLYAMRGLDEEG